MGVLLSVAMRDETALAIDAALEAGAHALRGFRSRNLSVARKTDMHDLVTAYDGECEALIRSRILRAFPDASIIGEEGAAHLGGGSLTWYVDPIDGTSNYARGIPMWAISIAAEQGGELIAGVIYDPMAAQLFWADESGAFVREPGRGIDVPLGTPVAGAPSEAAVALDFPLARDLAYAPQLALSQFAEVTRTFAQVRGLGSTCIALAWVAAGWIDAAISFETNPWDVAAGACIIRRAGGVFDGYRDGAVVAGSEAHLAPHYYAAGAGEDYGALRGIMRTQSRRDAATRSDTRG